jgi:hypothetical protein
MGVRMMKDSKVVINLTYTYLLPMLGLSCNIGRDSFINFRGIFLRNDDYPEIQDRLFLWLRASADRNYLAFEQQLRRLADYDSCYEPDKYHTIFLFKIPAEYKREYDKFIESRYSEFSENFKQALIKYHGYSKTNAGADIIKVLYKDPELYEAKEKEINKGLDYKEWTRIPRTQEIGVLLSERIEHETFSDDLKVQESMSPNNKLTI